MMMMMMMMIMIECSRDERQRCNDAPRAAQVDDINMCDGVDRHQLAVGGARLHVRRVPGARRHRGVRADRQVPVHPAQAQVDPAAAAAAL